MKVAKSKVAVIRVTPETILPDIDRLIGLAGVSDALAAAGLSLDQIDLVELNEAFASQALACARELGIDEERLNVNGGAIALGHPLGGSGARIMTTMLYHMRDKGIQ